MSEDDLNDSNGARSGWLLGGGVAWRRERWRRKKKRKIDSMVCRCDGGGAAIVPCEREPAQGSGRCICTAENGDDNWLY